MISQAQFIDNGMSIWGTIDDQYLDIFLVRCNTVGTIEMPLFSKSAPAYVRDLIFAIEPIDTTGGEVGYGQYYEFSDGTAAQMLTYQVPRPGIYAIYVLSAELYQYYNLNTDYAFYYTFKPQLSLD